MIECQYCNHTWRHQNVSVHWGFPLFQCYLLWLIMFGHWGVILVPWQLSSRRALDWTVLQGGLDLLCVPLKVFRLNVPVLSKETETGVTMSGKHVRAPNTSCLYKKNKLLPVDVGVADAACEVLKAAARRPPVVKSLYTGIQQGYCGWWRTFLLLLVFVINQQRIPKVDRSIRITCISNYTMVRRIWRISNWISLNRLEWVWLWKDVKTDTSCEVESLLVIVHWGHEEVRPAIIVLFLVWFDFGASAVQHHCSIL